MLRMTAITVITSVALLAAVAASGQAQDDGPKVGDVPPDFSLKGSTKDGPLASPVSLSNYRGQTVVLAFFPKARTKG